MTTNPETGSLGLWVQDEKDLQTHTEGHKCIISYSCVNKTVYINKINGKAQKLLNLEETVCFINRIQKNLNKNCNSDFKSQANKLIYH